jgi:GAF domain-containing protein
MNQAHRVVVGSLSVIGQVAQQGVRRLVHDTYTRDVHQDNEFFDDTRVELAIPMRLGVKVIGVLDVHSTQQNSFDDDLIAILETMADQIAITIENVRLYEKLQDRLREPDALFTDKRDASNWRDFMATQRTTELFDEAGSGTLVDFTDLRAQALGTKQEAIGELTYRQTIPIAVPIIFKSQVLGVIEWETPEHEFNNQIALAKELASRLALSLDNARLLQAEQQATINEGIINTISSKLSKQTDIEQIIQTTIQQIGHALHTPYVTVRLHPADDDV